MIEKLGKKAVALPLIALTFISLILGTVFYPLTHAEMKDVPLGIAILDTGIETPAGTVNAGEEMVKKLEETSSVFDIRRYSSQSEVDTALADNDVYGVLVFPEGFTAAQAAQQQTQGQQPQTQGQAQTEQAQTQPQAQSRGQGNQNTTPTLTLYINAGKNSMLAGQLAQLLPTQLAQFGVKVQVEQVNTADVGGGTMASMAVAQVLVMPLFMMSMISSILLFVIFRPRAGSSWRSTIAKQVPYALVLAGVVAAFDIAIASWFGGLTLHKLPLFGFFYIASLCIILAFVGALDIAVPLGGVVIADTFAFGMMTAMLAREMMPSFWRNWVCPWAPQYHIGEGVRSIVYFDSGVWTPGLPVLLAFGAAGIVLLSVRAILGSRSSATGDN